MKSDERWMLTIPKKKMSFHKLKKILIITCKKWTIGIEKGENGYEHYQCRVRFKTERNLEQVLELFNESTTELQVSIRKSAFRFRIIYIPDDGHDSGIYGTIAKSDDNIYEQKSGKWYSESNADICEFRCRGINNIQGSILRRTRKQGDRGITVVYDRVGGHGKTWLMKHLYAKGDTTIVPPTIASAGRMIAWCYGQKAKTYIIDLPRNISTKERSLWTAIETIKDGIFYDDRYYSKIRIQKNPTVIVMTNVLPPRSLLSDDRWDIIDIERDFSL